MLLDTVDKSKNATSAKSMAIDKKFNQKKIFLKRLRGKKRGYAAIVYDNFCKKDYYCTGKGNKSFRWYRESKEV